MKEKRIQDKVTLSSKNFTINALLFINRANKVKTFIEYIILNEPVFKPEEEYMKEIFRNVTELNFVFLIPYNIIENLNNLGYGIEKLYPRKNDGWHYKLTNLKKQKLEKQYVKQAEQEELL